MFTSLLAETAPAATGPNPLTSFVPIIFIFIIMYFLLFRPQVKRQKEAAKLVSALKTGDRVVTGAGIHGLISNVKDRTVILKIADNVKIEIEKSAVTSIITTDEAK
ncbi:MAG: preprotein translocase subunit YajC [Chthoniobacterales bacterium]